MKAILPHIIGSEINHQGKFTTMKTLQLSNGGKYEMVSRVGNGKAVSGIIRRQENGNIILIDQYRFPVQKRVVEMVAGLCDKNKSLEDTMKEEVQEETGFQTIESIQYLFEVTSSAGLTSETTELFSIIVSGERGEQNLGTLEDICVHEVPEKDIVSFLQQKQKEGMLLDGKILSALHMSNLHIQSILRSNK